MAQILGELKKKNGKLFTYRCFAHLLNLLEKDLQTQNTLEHIKQIVKYFRNHRFHGSFYKEGGKMLAMPRDGRWITMADSMQSYLQILYILVEICKELSNEANS